MMCAAKNLTRAENREKERKVDKKHRCMRDQTRFLDKEQLRQLLNLPSTRAVDELVRNKRIPVLRLGHRTVRFDWPKVEAALTRLEAKEAGR
jgi:hypothetical protein